MSIIQLVPPLPPSPPQEDVVAQLELLLALAQQGNITSLAYIAVGDSEKAPATGFSGPHRNTLIAGVVMLAADIQWRGE